VHSDASRIGCYIAKHSSLRHFFSPVWMNSWPLETQSRASPFWIPSGFFRIILVQHWNQGSPGQILFEKKTTGSLLCLPVLFIETDSRMQDQKQKEAPQQVAAENILHPADFCFRFVFVFLLRLCCLSLNFLFLCFHCSNCSVSCVVLQRSTCVVSWFFLCVSSSLSVVSRSCWSRGCVASQCSGASF